MPGTKQMVTAPLDTLNDVLDRARRAPFYRDRLRARRLQRWQDWQDVPLTSKEDLRTSYPFGLLAVARQNLASYHESSGSTGEPTPSFFTEADWDDITTRFSRNAVNLSASDCVLVKTPYSLVTTAHQMHRAARSCGAMVIPGDNRTSNLSYPKVIRLLRDLDVTVAWCMPTEALLWVAAARAASYRPAKDFPELRAFVVAGESLSPAKQKRICDLWGGTRVFQDYGSTETGSLAGECQQGALHFWSDRVFAEVLDPQTGRTEQSGRGQLVVTPLFRDAMPLVRYLIDDTVEISYEPCACGAIFPTIRILGRALSAAKIGNKEFFASDLEDAIYSLPIEIGVLFWRARYDATHLQIEIDAPLKTVDEACHVLRKEVANRLGLVATVQPAPNHLVSSKLLTQTAPFLKPRFLFRADEDWNGAIHY